EWPSREDGSPSFRLEDLTRANRISHEDAHDALSDVRATIALAGLVRDKQRRLFDWGRGLRDQKTVAELLDPADPKPVLHTTSRIAAAKGCTSLVMPLSVHPHYRKSVIVFDLMADPEPLLQESAEQLQDRVFTPRADLPEGIERLPLKEVKTNGVPMVAPAATLRGVDCRRIGLDPDRCLEHARQIKRSLPQLGAKVMDIYSSPPREEVDDPDLQIYSGGFFSGRDKKLMAQLRATPPDQLHEMDWPFQDARLPEMLFRFRARNFPETLAADEAERWEKERLQRLRRPPDNKQLSATQFWRELGQARVEQEENPQSQVILDQLEDWAIDLGLHRDE
ncbi:MAG: exodeoxyribonuclease I, partial [Gammaproteobacteria bacterium]|nr:exodeoxyribonuclease I [Gammaproteobacteria bacterium]